MKPSSDNTHPWHSELHCATEPFLAWMPTGFQAAAGVRADCNPLSAKKIVPTVAGMLSCASLLLPPRSCPTVDNAASIDDGEARAVATTPGFS